jgi:nucleolar complex protein 2
VQDRVRVAQNCFTQILGLDLVTSYQLGFLYIRQLCLHIRNIRNNLTKDGIKNIYSWQFYNCMKIWALAVTEHLSELVLLVHPLVQLGIAALRLTNNPKYFPYHLKVFQMLTLINQKTHQFVPIAQYLLYPFDSASDFLNSKPKALQDKSVPDTLVSLKYAKKHAETAEVKDRVVRELVDELTLYYAANSRMIGFPEMTVAIGVVLRKFKKYTHNGNYRKIVAAFMELLKKNEEYIVQKRTQMKEKSIKNVHGMLHSFEAQFG